MKKKSIRAIVLEWVTKILKDEELEVICQPEEIKKEAQATPREELQAEAKIISPIEIEESEKQESKPENDKIIEKKPKKKPSNDIIVDFDPRDMMELMEVPFLALSKNRTKPIIYESNDGKTKVQVSAHRKHYVASIYDWDIIQLVSGKMQEIINSGADIPPRTLIIARHTLIKSLRKHDVRKTAKEIEAALNRLRSTLIETTIRNDDSRYQGGFGFLDSWGYTERKDIKEFRITLSDWLYDGICRKGALLKVSQEYFDLTSGLKKFLYRTARKHVGNNNNWEFSIDKLYEKSGSEREFKKFKHDLKKSVLDNDIPDYFLEWMEEKEKILVRFVNKSKDPKKIPKQTVKNQVNKAVSALKMPSQFKK
jgi:plasmid replication initiation protein